MQVCFIHPGPCKRPVSASPGAEHLACSLAAVPLPVADFGGTHHSHPSGWGQDPHSLQQQTLWSRGTCSPCLASVPGPVSCPLTCFTRIWPLLYSFLFSPILFLPSPLPVHIPSPAGRVPPTLLQCPGPSGLQASSLFVVSW